MKNFVIYLVYASVAAVWHEKIVSAQKFVICNSLDHLGSCNQKSLVWMLVSQSDYLQMSHHGGFCCG